MKRAKCSSDAEKPTKKTNAEHLVELKRGSYVSQSALAEKLAKVRQDGIPEASSRSSQVRARKKSRTWRRRMGLASLIASSRLVARCK